MTYVGGQDLSQYSGNGETSEFPTGFGFLTNDDVRLLHTSVGGVDTLLVEGVDYSLSGAGQEEGTAVFPKAGSGFGLLAVGEKLTIYLDPVISQERAFSNASVLPLIEIERGMDKLTMIARGIMSRLKRSVMYPMSASEVEVGTPQNYISEINAQRQGAEDAAGQADVSAMAAATSASAAAESASAAAISAVAYKACQRTATSFAPSQADSPNMTVRLAAGAILSGVTLTEVAAQSTTTISAPSANPRIDRVVIDKTSGAVSVVAGSEGANPSAPAIPAGKLPVAQVALSVGQTAITDANITDERVGGSGGGVELVQNLLDPGPETAPSTQAVADELDDARALAMFNAIMACIAAARASGSIPGGYVWTFASDELATKTGATYDSTNKRYANAGAQTQVAQASGSIITTFPSNTANAWDGNSSQGIASSSYAGAAGVRYTGKDWGSGNTKIVTGFKAWGSTDQGFCDSGGGTVTHTLYGSNTAPTGPTDGTSLGSVTAANATGSPLVSKLDISSTTAYRYHWLTQSGAQTTNCCYAEVQFFESTTATNMTLIPAAITAGAAPTLVDVYILHKAVDATTLNTDLKARVSRDNGSNWSGFVTLAEVCQFDINYKVLHGQVDLSALASGTSVKWEITTLNTKSQQVRAVGMLLR